MTDKAEGRHFSENDKRLKFIPEVEAVVPPSDLIKHVKDCWWLVHPTKGLLIFIGHDRRQHTPQCHTNKRITESMHWMAPWAEIKFFKSVFYKINPHDYC